MLKQSLENKMKKTSNSCDSFLYLSNKFEKVPNTLKLTG
jgi:hypothetical protein